MCMYASVYVHTYVRTYIYAYVCRYIHMVRMYVAHVINELNTGEFLIRTAFIDDDDDDEA